MTDLLILAYSLLALLAIPTYLEHRRYRRNWSRRHRSSRGNR